MSRRERPPNTFDAGLQHERTALAWERTSIAMMVSGVVFARHAAGEAGVVFAVLGLAQTALGGGLFVWAGAHYEDLHGRLRSGDAVVHPTVARVVGLSTVLFTGFASLFAVLVALR